MVKSRLSDVAIPEVPLHFAVFSKFEEYDDRAALVDGITDKSYTFREVRDTCLRVSSGLARQGVKKGDILAIFSPNNPEYVFAFFGAVGVGATVTTANPVYTVYEFSRQLKDSGAKYVYTTQELSSKATQAAAQTNGQVKKVFVLGQASGCIPFSVLLGDDGKGFDPMKVPFNAKEDVVALPYSSGTTGLPKGVMLTHYNIVSNLLQLAHESFRFGSRETSGNTVLAFLPFFHSYGMVIIMCLMLAGGAKLVTLPRFVPEPFLRAIQKHKVTAVPLVPPILIFLSKSPLVKKYDLSSVTRVSCGAAPLRADTAAEFKKHIPADVQQGYGLTETGPTVCAPPAIGHKSGSVGILLSHTEVQIVDVDTKKVLGPNEKGEVWIRGPQVMKGYHNRPEATRDSIDDDRWFHSGDIGYYDEDEHFYIVDRIKELIKYKGFQVAPAELEELLVTHPAIQEAAVVGIPNEEAGEVPLAFVVKRMGAKITEKDIIQFVEDNVSPFKRLRGGVKFVQEVPKTPTGKLLRRQLKEMVKSSKL